MLCLQARVSLVLPLLGLPIAWPRIRPSAAAPTRSVLSRFRPTLAAIGVATVLGEVQLVTLVCAHRFFESRRRRHQLQLVIRGVPISSRPVSPPAEGASTPATCPICAAAESDTPADPIEAFCSEAPFQHLFHRSCLVRWLRTFTADQALDDSGGNEVVLGSAPWAASSVLDPVSARAREALQELFWRAGLFLDLRAKHEPVGRPPAARQPPPTKIMLSSQAAEYLSHATPPSSSWNLFGKPPAPFRTWLGSLTTSAPPCPACRSPLVFHLSLARPDAEPGDRGLGALWIATWSALVSGQTIWGRGKGMAGAVALLAVLQSLPSI